MIRFASRIEAGRLLARRLRAQSRGAAVTVVPLDSRGVPVAREVALAIEGATLITMPLLWWTRSFVADDAFASELRGHRVLLVADGIESAAPAAAAIARVRGQHAERVVLAAPVASASAVRDLAGRADELVVLGTPRPFHSARFWYGDLTPSLERPRQRRKTRQDTTGPESRGGPAAASGKA